MSKDGQNKIYQLVTDRIVEQLEKGTIPWKKPWSSELLLPANFKSKKPYRGSNILMLLSSGFTSKYWLTFKQAKELGGTVKHGEEGTPVTYWNFIDGKDKNSEESKRAFLRYYTVFNLTQCEGITVPQSPSETKPSILPLTLADEIVKNYPQPAPTIITAAFAGYQASSDTIAIPASNSFSSSEEYYSTLFHELTHSTGHPTRLARFSPNQKVSKNTEDYSKEELIAEFGSAFLCAKAGISNSIIANQSSYIAGWLNSLKNDNKLLLRAASKAQLSTDFITKETYEKNE